MHSFLFYFYYERNPKTRPCSEVKGRVFVTGRSRTISLLGGKRKVPILNGDSHPEKDGCHHSGVICLWEKCPEICRREKSHLSLIGRAHGSPSSLPLKQDQAFWAGFSGEGRNGVALLRLQRGKTWQRLRTATGACSAREILHGQVFPHLNDEPGGMLVVPACARFCARRIRPPQAGAGSLGVCRRRWSPWFASSSHWQPPTQSLRTPGPYLQLPSKETWKESIQSTSSQGTERGDTIYY